MDERPFTPKELAERWAVSDQHIRDLCNAGKIPSFRVGRAFRIPADFVRESEACNTDSNPTGGNGAPSGEKTDKPAAGHSASTPPKVVKLPNPR